MKKLKETEELFGKYFSMDLLEKKIIEFSENKKLMKNQVKKVEVQETDENLTELQAKKNKILKTKKRKMKYIKSNQEK